MFPVAIKLLEKDADVPLKLPVKVADLSDAISNALLV